MSESARVETFCRGECRAIGRFEERASGLAETHRYAIARMWDQFTDSPGVLTCAIDSERSELSNSAGKSEFWKTHGRGSGMRSGDG